MRFPTVDLSSLATEVWLGDQLITVGELTDRHLLEEANRQEVANFHSNLNMQFPAWVSVGVPSRSRKTPYCGKVRIRRGLSERFLTFRRLKTDRWIHYVQFDLAVIRRVCKVKLC